MAIVDVRLPPTFTDEGLRAAIEARERHPGLGVLILSQYVEPVYTAELLGLRRGRRRLPAQGARRRGARRSSTPSSASPRAARRWTARSSPSSCARAARAARRTARSASLTPREREVLELMAEGRSNAAVARALVVSGGAVEKHVRNIFAKLDLPASDDDHRRVLAVLAYLRAGAA